MLLETTTTRLTAELKDLKEGLNFTNEHVNTLKVTLSEKADVARVKDLETQVEDLENRSKRNNIVIWNIPEGAERDSSCQELATNILSNQMGLDGHLEIMRAHRTSIKKRLPEATAATPRPEHVYLLRYTDKKYILRNAASELRDNPFLEVNLYISDDVSKSVRDNRKKLKERHLEEFRQREDVEFAYIPWTIPACILYKVQGESRLHSFFLQAANAADNVT